MLRRTFIHLPAVGLATEARWWRQGILTWTDALEHLPQLVRPLGRRLLCRQILEQSLAQQHEPRFFAPLLRPSEHWRLYGEFRERTAFLDIETSPDDFGYHEITMIGLYDGFSYRPFVQGDNLDAFEEAVQDFQLVATFNGARFDLPVIRNHFRHLRAPWVHIDLRYVLARLGLRGGLKAIELERGIERSADVRGLNGWDAVRLWQGHRSGEPAALPRLIRYNRADVVNLKTLMDFAYESLSRRLTLPGLASRDAR